MDVDIWHKSFIDTKCITVMMEALKHNVDIDSPVDDKLNTKLMFAVKEDDRAMAQCLLGYRPKGANINLTNDNGKTAIVLACKKSSFDMYTLIYDYGATVDHRKCFKYCMSKNKPNVKIFNHLMSHGYHITYNKHRRGLENFIPHYIGSADFNNDIFNSLCVTVGNNESIFPYLIRANNKDLFTKMLETFTPTVDDLLLSYKIGDFYDEILRNWENKNYFEYLKYPQLIYSIVSINIEFLHNIIPYIIALKNKRPDINVNISIPVKFFIDRTGNSSRKLFRASQILFNYGFLDINSMNTMLYNNITFEDDIESIQWIITSCPSITMNWNSFSLLCKCVQLDAYNTFDYLVTQGVSITDKDILMILNKNNFKNFIPLMSPNLLFQFIYDEFDELEHFITKENYTSFMKYCIKSNSSSLILKTVKKLRLTSSVDDTELFHTFYLIHPNKCNETLFKMFENQINQRNSQGTYPLYVMCKYGLTKQIKILLDLGANPNLKTSKGKTAIFASTDINITKMLLESGANHNAHCNKGNNILLNIINKALSCNICYIINMFNIEYSYRDYDNYILFLLSINSNVKKCNFKGESFAMKFYNNIHRFDTCLHTIMEKLCPFSTFKTTFDLKYLKLTRRKPTTPKPHFIKNYSINSKRSSIYQCVNRTKD